MMANRHYHLKYHITNDADIIERLDAQESIQGYIRRLIQTDILADSLQGVFKVEERDPEEQIRIDWYNEHCPAINDPDYNCEGCFYHRYSKDDVAGTGSGYCDADSFFHDYLKHVYKEGVTHAKHLQKPEPSVDQ